MGRWSTIVQNWLRMDAGHCLRNIVFTVLSVKAQIGQVVGLIRHLQFSSFVSACSFHTSCRPLCCRSNFTQSFTDYLAFSFVSCSLPRRMLTRNNFVFLQSIACISTECEPENVWVGNIAFEHGEGWGITKKVKCQSQRCRSASLSLLMTSAFALG